MKFFKPTRAKIIITILLLLFSGIPLFYDYFFKVSFGMVCLPVIGEAGDPLPTPIPLTVNNTVNDFYRFSTKQAGTDFSPCFPDPSYQFASALFVLSQIVCTIAITYITSCLFVFCISKLRKQKKRRKRSKDV